MELFGISLVAGLDEVASKSKINNTLKTLGQQLENVKVNIAVDQKVLTTIKNFNKELQQLNATAQSIDTNISKALRKNIVSKEQINNAKKLRTETHELGNAAKAASDDTVRAHKRTKQSLQDLTSEYTKQNKIIVKSNKDVLNSETNSRPKTVRNNNHSNENLQEQIALRQAEAKNKVDKLQSGLSTKLSNEDSKALNNYVQSINKITAASPNALSQMDRLDKQFLQLKSSIQQTGGGMTSFSKQFGSAMLHLPIFANGVSALTAPLFGLRDALKQIIEIDTQMTVLDRVSNGQIQINQALEDSINIAEKLGNTIAQVNDGMINFARQGYRGEDLSAITEVATIMGNVSDLSIDESASSLTAAMKAFNIEAKDSIRIVDSLNEVDKLFVPCISNNASKSRICWKTVIQPSVVYYMRNYIVA